MDSPLVYAGRIAYSSKEVLQFSYDQARKYKDIPNTCMVEMGVAAGAQIIALAHGSDGKVPIYAIDSYAGIPLPSNRDNQMPGIAFLSKAEQQALPDPGKQVLVSSGATVVPLKDVVEHIKNSGVKLDKIYFIEGWFEEVLPNFASFACPPISLLRLDGDLYNSTYVSLKYLYPKVIKGGCIIIDDWALPGCRAAVYDYFTSMKGVFEWPLKMEYITDENSTVAHWVK